jgi:4-amino-4-deoxy-L-arabinose transferase-like glycosyltransferase
MRALLALGLVVPVAAGGVAALEGFDGLYGQDPFAYFDYATGAVRRSLLELEPLPPFFWPPGYPLLVGLVSLAVGPQPLAGQLVSLASGALVPVFTMLLAREVWPRPPGEADRDAAAASSLHVPLLAGLLVALTGQLWQSSVVVMADTLGLAGATAGVWALARYGRGAALRWLLLAAALLAAATMTRWIYGIVAVPCTAFALWTAFHRRPPRTALVHAGAAALVGGAVLAPVAVASVLHAVREGGCFAPFAGNFQVYRWNPLGAFRSEFVTPDGRLTYERATGLYYAAAPARWAFFTPLLAPLVLPGLWAVFRRRAAAPTLLLAGWAAVVFVFHAGAAYQNFRFTLAFLPPLAVLAAIGAEVVLGRLRGRRSFPLAVGVLAIGLGLMAAAGVHTTRSLIDMKNRSLDVVRWTEARTPAGARLVTFDLTSSFRHYGTLPTVELYHQDPADLARLLERDEPLYLLVDTAKMEGQWAEESPGRNARWLEAGPGLTPLGEVHGFTLFRVGPDRYGTPAGP